MVWNYATRPSELMREQVTPSSLLEKFPFGGMQIASIMLLRSAVWRLMNMDSMRDWKRREVPRWRKMDREELWERMRCQSSGGR